MQIRNASIVIVLGMSLIPQWVKAEETVAPSSPPVEVTSNPAKDPSDQKTSSRRSRGRAREKEADGTQAPNRFNTADTIPKSVYRDERTGQHYEVDTD